MPVGASSAGAIDAMVYLVRSPLDLVDFRPWMGTPVRKVLTLVRSGR